MRYVGDKHMSADALALFTVKAKGLCPLSSSLLFDHVFWDIICHWTLSCWFSYVDRSVSLQDALISGPRPHHSRVTDCGNTWGLEILKFRFSFLHSKYCSQWPHFIPVAIRDFVVVLFFIFLRESWNMFSILAIFLPMAEIYTSINSIKSF